jgi:hypothetical protein
MRRHHTPIINLRLFRVHARGSLCTCPPHQMQCTGRMAGRQEVLAQLDNATAGHSCSDSNRARLAISAFFPPLGNFPVSKLRPIPTLSATLGV